MTARPVGSELTDILRLRRTAYIPDLDAAPGCRAAQLFILGKKGVQAAGQVEASVDSGQELPAPGFGQSASHGGNANQEGIWLIGQGLGNIFDHRYALAKARG